MQETTPTYELISQGNKNGVALLYERYGKRLYGYALSSWKLGEDEAWDMVYKTLYKVAESTAMYTFASEEKYGSFIFKVFINYLRTHYRDQKARPGLLQFDDSHTEVTEPVQEPDSEEMILLKEELDKLEDWERVLLLMRSQDMPYSEIAKYVNKPAEQLKVYYQRLKTALVKRMNDKLSVRSMPKDDNEQQRVRRDPHGDERT
jgi:RNA polymerase sigma factor (sigma-70 family)